MKLLILAATMSSLLAAAGAGPAGAGPTPKVTVTCTVGDTTVVQWQRVRVVNVGLDWSGPAGAVYAPVSSPVSPKPPRGTLTSATPVDSTAGAPATSVTATLTPDGGGEPLVVTVSCG